MPKFKVILYKQQQSTLRKWAMMASLKASEVTNTCCTISNIHFASN